MLLVTRWERDLRNECQSYKCYKICRLVSDCECGIFLTRFLVWGEFLQETIQSAPSICGISILQVFNIRTPLSLSHWHLLPSFPIIEILIWWELTAFPISQAAGPQGMEVLHVISFILHYICITFCFSRVKESVWPVGALKLNGLMSLGVKN